MLIAKCRQGAELLVGKHDFTHFASQGNPDPNPIKTIYRFDVLPDADGYVFQVEGSGFMYKMVSSAVQAKQGVLPILLLHRTGHSCWCYLVDCGASDVVPSSMLSGGLAILLSSLTTVPQVRHMVGALLAVGAGNLQVDVIAQKLAMGSNELPGEAWHLPITAFLATTLSAHTCQCHALLSCGCSSSSSLFSSLLLLSHAPSFSGYTVLDWYCFSSMSGTACRCQLPLVHCVD